MKSLVYNNNINFLPSEIGLLINLKELDCSFNKIKFHFVNRNSYNFKMFYKIRNNLF
jgi:hypothetical protein